MNGQFGLLTILIPASRLLKIGGLFVPNAKIVSNQLPHRLHLFPDLRVLQQRIVMPVPQIGTAGQHQ